MHVDDTYLRILDVLQRDGRACFTDVASRVDRAETTVRDRVTALEREGIIRGYHAAVDLARIGYGARGVVRADVDRARLDELVTQLKALPEVVRAFVTTGRRPVTIELVARDLEAMEQVLEDRLAPTPLESPELGVLVRELVPRRPRDLSRRLDGTRAVALG